MDAPALESHCFSFCVPLCANTVMHLVAVTHTDTPASTIPGTHTSLLTHTHTHTHILQTPALQNSLTAHLSLTEKETCATLALRNPRLAPPLSQLCLILIPAHDVIQAELVLHLNSSILPVPRLQCLSLSKLAVGHWLHRLVAQVAHKLLEGCRSKGAVCAKQAAGRAGEGAQVRQDPPEAQTR